MRRLQIRLLTLRMKFISVSSISELHGVLPRALDGKLCVLCSLKNRTNEWIVRDSIIESDDELTSRLLYMETHNSWPPFTSGGRRKILKPGGGAYAKKGEVLSAFSRRSNVKTTHIESTLTNAQLMNRVLELERLVGELEQKLLHLMLPQCISPCVALPMQTESSMVQSSYPESSTQPQAPTFVSTSLQPLSQPEHYPQFNTHGHYATRDFVPDVLDLLDVFMD